MANTKLITRTIKTYSATFNAFNMAENQLYELTQLVPEKYYNDNEKLLKYGRKHFETDTIKLLAVCNKETNEQLYAITEEDFIKHGHPYTR